MNTATVPERYRYGDGRGGGYRSQVEGEHLQKDADGGRQRHADEHSSDKGIGPCSARSLMGSKTSFCHSYNSGCQYLI